MKEKWLNLFNADPEVKTTLWLDFLAYANRLFNGNKGNLFGDASQFLSVYRQGQGLLQSDVVSIQMDDFYGAWLNSNADVMESWKGKKPTFILKKLLAEQNPKEILTEIMTGLTTLYPGHPFVLVLSSPQKWLQWIEQIIPGKPWEHEDVDTATMYLADFLRNFSTISLSAILLKEGVDPSIGIKEAMTYYQPILNVAKYYNWAIGIEHDWSDDELPMDEIDYYLYSEMVLDSSVGGRLNKEYWLNQKPFSELETMCLYYGTIPEDTKPEWVLEKIKEIRR